MKYRIISILLLTASIATAQTPIWSEEFNSGSVINSDVWTAETGDGSQYGIPGWGNGELQNYTSSTNNLKVENGNLVITARRNGDSFTSGRIMTQNKLFFKYGTVEARIQTPDLANGLWPAFWTLGNDWQQGVSWPNCGEIDIMEMGNKDAITADTVNRRVASTAHWDHDGGYVNYGSPKTLLSDIDDTFVIYRMEWTPTEIKTYIDYTNGTIDIWTIDISEAVAPELEEFHKPHFFLLNMAVGGGYTGIDNAGGITALPVSGASAEYKVDWIRIYDNGFTELGGASQLDRGSNLLANAGFESGTSDWELNIDTGSASGSGTHAQNGSQSLLIDSTGAAGWSSPNLSQTFPAIPGEVYRMEGYLLNPSSQPIAGNSFGLFKIEFRDYDNVRLNPASVDIGTSAAAPFYGAESVPRLTAASPTDTWIFSHTQAVAPANTATVGFYVLNVNEPGNPGPMFYDSIESLWLEDILPFSLQSSLVGGNFQINFPSQNGIIYEVHTTSSLTNSAWTPMETIIGNGDTNTVSYPVSDPARFYKVIAP